MLLRIVIGKMARCFGTSEELAFVNGTGENQPIGILHDTKGQKRALQRRMLHLSAMMKLLNCTCLWIKNIASMVHGL